MSIKKLTDFSEFETLAADEIRSCTRKVVFQSEEMAERAARSMAKKHNEAFEAYACRYRPHWHVGHSHTFGVTINGTEYKGAVEIIIKDGLITVNQLAA